MPNDAIAAAFTRAEKLVEPRSRLMGALGISQASYYEFRKRDTLPLETAMKLALIVDADWTELCPEFIEELNALRTYIEVF